MTHLESTATRTLTIVLPEDDWRALRAAEPDAIAWLQARIRERLAATDSTAVGGYSPPTTPAADSWWGNDEY